MFTHQNKNRKMLLKHLAVRKKFNTIIHLNLFRNLGLSVFSLCC